MLLLPGVNRTARLPHVDLTAFTGEAVYFLYRQFQVILDRPKETRYFPERQAYRLDAVPRQHPDNAVEYRPHVRQESY
jgi:hypothetical protein